MVGGEHWLESVGAKVGKKMKKGDLGEQMKFKNGVKTHEVV